MMEMSEPEMIKVEEHYSTVIRRVLSIRMEYTRQGRTDDESNTHTWQDLWNYVAAWAQKYGHPSVAGNYPVFLKRIATDEGDTCDEGDTEIARASESYVRAIDDMRVDNIAIKRDGRILYLADPVKRAKYLEAIGERADA
jgi:hypothetical protein